MTAAQSLVIMKALADESRLAIVSSLLEKPQYVEEIAKRHALASSTVSFHLRKLEHAGLVCSRKEQYYVVVAANEPLLDTTLKELVSVCSAGKELQDERIDEYRRKVVAAFFRNGMLEKLPAQQKKRLIVLEQFALRFEPGRRYGESEVTGLIRPLFDDYCTIRRLLIEEGMIRREGSSYWREVREGRQPAPVALAQECGTERARNRRAELKQSYKESRPAMGVYQIRNRLNGKLFIDSSTNLAGTRTSREFQLRMGKFPSSPSLQKELFAHGAAAFEVSMLEELPPLQPGQQAERLLMELKLRWQERLHPFGEQGYNSPKQFEREKARLGEQVP